MLLCKAKQFEISVNVLYHIQANQVVTFLMKEMHFFLLVQQSDFTVET